MPTCKIGNLVRSKAGHDKDELFFVLDIVGEYIYLVDGKTRSVSHPKKKKLKHVQCFNYQDENLVQIYEQGISLKDEDIRYAMKKYRRLENGKI
jgi:hypothetical protein